MPILLNMSTEGIKGQGPEMVAGGADVPSKKPVKRKPVTPVIQKLVKKKPVKPVIKKPVKNKTVKPVIQKLVKKKPVRPVKKKPVNKLYQKSQLEHNSPRPGTHIGKPRTMKTKKEMLESDKAPVIMLERAEVIYPGLRERTPILLNLSTEGINGQGPEMVAGGAVVSPKKPVKRKHVMPVIQKPVKKKCVTPVINKPANKLYQKSQLEHNSPRPDTHIGVPKLDDANDAGTSNSLNSATIIHPVGDSAEMLAVSAPGMSGREKHGVFLLRGELYKLREHSEKRWVFDDSCRVRTLESPEPVLKDFLKVFFTLYAKSKANLELMLQAEVEKINSQLRFINEVRNGEIFTLNKKKMIDNLKQRGYPADPVIALEKTQNRDEALSELVENEDSDSSESGEDSDPRVQYHYLLGMTILAFTKERQDELLKERDDKLQELNTLQRKTASSKLKEDMYTFLQEISCDETI